jgi:hypothetical protein
MRGVSELEGLLLIYRLQIAGYQPQEGYGAVASTKRAFLKSIQAIDMSMAPWFGVSNTKAVQYTKNEGNRISKLDSSHYVVIAKSPLSNCWEIATCPVYGLDRPSLSLGINSKTLFRAIKQKTGACQGLFP